MTEKFTREHIAQVFGEPTDEERHEHASWSAAMDQVNQGRAEAERSIGAFVESITAAFDEAARQMVATANAFTDAVGETLRGRSAPRD